MAVFGTPCHADCRRSGCCCLRNGYVINKLDRDGKTSSILLHNLDHNDIEDNSSFHLLRFPFHNTPILF